MKAKNLFREVGLPVSSKEIRQVVSFLETKEGQRFYTEELCLATDGWYKRYRRKPRQYSTRTSTADGVAVMMSLERKELVQLKGRETRLARLRRIAESVATRE